MILLILLTGCVFASATATDRPHYDLDKAQEYFDTFITTYKKHYDDRNDEKTRRYEVFKENLKNINRLNSLNRSIYGITKFTDLSAAEFKAQMGCLGPVDSLRRGTCTAISDDDITGVEAPDSLDLRNSNRVTSVKNQGQCKSCWAFTSVGIIEGAYSIKYGELKTFSPKQLMDCLPSTGHCLEHGNTMRTAFADLIGTAGVMLEEDYPYVAEDSPCAFEAEKAKVNVTSCNYYTLQNEEKLKEALVQRGPIGLGLDADTLQNYVGGVLDLETCPSDDPNHAVLLVGYGTDDDGKNYWLIKNSWGADWGEHGYFRVERGHDVCGMHNNHQTVAEVE